MKFRFLCLFYLLFQLVSCSLDELRDDNVKIKSRMSLEEARAAFENEYAGILTKSGFTEKPHDKLFIGDFTPVWDGAVYSADEFRCSYDVDMLGGRKIDAVRTKYENGRAVAAKVNVYQKLIVMKDTKSGIISSFLLFLIPDYGCDKGAQAMQFSNFDAKKGNFSGIAVYKSLQSEMIIRVDKYESGVKINGVFVPDGDGTVKERVLKVASMLNGISFVNRRHMAVKSYGEDDWGDDWDSGDDWWYSNDEGWNYGDIDNYSDIGFGFFIDEFGNVYYDTDGDGIPDTMVLEAAVCTPDNGNKDEDSGEKWPPDDPGAGEGADSGKEDVRADDEDNQVPGSDDSRKAPSLLTEFIGSPEFYTQRIIDFCERHRNDIDKIEPPSYYRDYGEKYCIRFNSNEFMDRVSEQGQEWSKDVTVLLQEKLNQILSENPDIELNNALLEELAFQSHVFAYLEAGLLDLEMADKLTILFTVDYPDLLRDEGLQQVESILYEQVFDYLNNPDEVIKDADYIINHVSDIVDLIVENINRTLAETQTKSVMPEYSPQEIFDMVLGDLIKYYEDNIPGFEMPPLQ